MSNSNFLLDFDKKATIGDGVNMNDDVDQHVKDDTSTTISEERDDAATSSTSQLSVGSSSTSSYNNRREDDATSVAGSTHSTDHSRERKKERNISKDIIQRVKKFGKWERTYENRWKVEHEGYVVILSDDKRELVTCYKKAEINPAIPFYNDLCDRIDTIGKYFKKYEQKMTLEEFSTIIDGQKVFHEMNFDEWPANKPLLVQTARNGRLDLMKYLLEECLYNPFIVGKDGFSILHYACYDGRYEMIEYVLKNEELRDGLLTLKTTNGETGLDALKNSTKLTEENRQLCLSLFEKYCTTTSSGDSSASSSTTEPLVTTSTAETLPEVIVGEKDDGIIGNTYVGYENSNSLLKLQ